MNRHTGAGICGCSAQSFGSPVSTPVRGSKVRLDGITNKNKGLDITKYSPFALRSRMEHKKGNKIGRKILYFNAT